MSISLRTTLRTTTAVLVVACLTLAVLVLRQIAQTGPEDTAPGEVVPLIQAGYGPATPMRVPGRDVVFRVGHPVEQLDHRLVPSSYDGPDPDLLVAPKGGRLVPITWQVYPTVGLGADVGQPHMTVRLLSGEQAITVWTPRSDDGGLDPTRSFAVAVAGQPDLSDLTLEVETDGVVQRLDPATGEIDAGAAQALYDPRVFATSCELVRMGCTLSAASPDQPLLPADVGVIADQVLTYPYDETLGWAPDGTVWAATRVQVLTGYAYDSSGENYVVRGEQALRVELIGSNGDVIEPTRNQLAQPNNGGQVVFAVPTDVEPTELVLTTRATLSDSERRMPLQARIRLN